MVKLRQCRAKFRSVKPLPRYGDFFDYSRWLPPPSWIFKFFEILTVGTLKMAKLRPHDKFCQNRSNRGRDMAISHFSQSWICDACVRTTREGHLVVFITVQNLVGIDAVVSITRMFFISRAWLENAYSGPQNWGFGGQQRNPCTDCKSTQ